MVGPVKHVVSVKQSPMSATRWCVDLDCGHEQWITSKSRPTRKTLRCTKCPQVRHGTTGGEKG